MPRGTPFKCSGCYRCFSSCSGITQHHEYSKRCTDDVNHGIIYDSDYLYFPISNSIEAINNNIERDCDTVLIPPDEVDDHGGAVYVIFKYNNFDDESPDYEGYSNVTGTKYIQRS